MVRDGGDGLEHQGIETFISHFLGRIYDDQSIRFIPEPLGHVLYLLSLVVFMIFILQNIFFLTDKFEVKK